LPATISAAHEPRKPPALPAWHGCDHWCA